MQLVAVKLYPAADEDGCGNRAYAYAAHSTEVHKGNCQTASNECAVEAVFDDAEFNFADEGDNQDEALTGSNKILARMQRNTPKARRIVLRIQSNHCQNKVSGATQLNRLIEKSMQ